LDEFSYKCFAPDVEIIKIRSNEDKDSIEEIQPDAIFVESAWNGNDGAWQYKIAKYAADTGNELVDLLHLANDRKLPSIFWNKEDPTHYERFIDKAKLFDYIFTSDSNTIDRYRRDVKHKRIYPLPFAAQPRIQNPLLDEKRKWNVCFSGTYYGDIFPERKQDMEILLRPAPIANNGATLPRTTTLPFVGLITLATRRNNVVFPAPLAPIKPKTSPFWMRMSTPSTALNGFLRRNPSRTR